MAGFADDESARPAVSLGDLPPDVETEAQLADARRRRHTFEGLEDARLIGARDALAQVLDLQPRPAFGGPR